MSVSSTPETALETPRPARPWAIYALLAGAVLAFVLIYRALQPAADWVTYRALHLVRGTHLGDAVNFFLYDTVKIGLLLACCWCASSTQ
jgi:hypothetical protein